MIYKPQILLIAGHAVAGYARRLLRHAKPATARRLRGAAPGAIIEALGPFEVKGAAQIGGRGFDVISDRAHLNLPTLTQAEHACTLLNELCSPPAFNPAVAAVVALWRVHDLLYLDARGPREFYSLDKYWDSDTMSAIAEIVAEFIPRPAKPRQPR